MKRRRKEKEVVKEEGNEMEASPWEDYIGQGHESDGEILEVDM